MRGWRRQFAATAMAGIGLGLGIMATGFVPLAEAQTRGEADRARKAYEEHMKRMDEAEKAPTAKPAPQAQSAPAAAPKAAAAPAAPAVKPAMSQADQDAATERGLEQYRRMMKEDPWSNPALLDADRGEALWTDKRGPKKVSLAETCDLGKGVGNVDGAFAEMPRYFADVDRVMDTETRILWCMENFQDFDSTAFRKSPHPGGGQPVKDVGAMATFIASKSAGMKIASHADHPKEKEAIALGEMLFFRRQAPFDFSCATCHAESGKRIRLQPLPFLSDPKEAKVVVGEWPAYRVSNTHVMTMQHRLLDCYWQMRMHKLDFGSEVSVALSAYLYDRARGGTSAAPGLKR
ncbi:MAG TPA: sulfur oxidation c-type cytochrome SoxA [Hyphomicrobiaceae bacterium]|nr:sulfur oxidation c-type cytochrome SoxA [Hyphomicrobiaceae bacterium]